MYHASSISQIYKKLHTSPKGLSQKKAEVLLKKYGENKFPRSGERVSRLKIFINQWKSPLIIILFVAGIISAFLGEFIDMTVIFITVGVNSLVGFIQEDKASQSLKRLQSMIEYKALVLRDGKKIRLPSEKIVPGDILFLEPGDKIQADGRIIEHTDLQINEAALTGESEPVKKTTKAVKKHKTIGDRANMVYRGTSVVNGRAKIVITATGSKTEIGKIASMVKETKEDKTPLQAQISKLGKYIGLIVLTISVFLFILGFVKRDHAESVFHLFETSVAVAVAAIPEGLVISVTIILAIGMQRILKRNAIVRKLVSAETLGSVSVICADKTGTLTEGKMTLTKLITHKQDMSLDDLRNLDITKREKYPDVLGAIKIAVLCNDAESIEGGKKEEMFVGDSTETALLRAGYEIGLEKNNLEKIFTRVDEIPFNSSNKFMATLNRSDHETYLYVKGAPEVVYDFCGFYEEDGEVKKMTKKARENFFKKQEELTGKGLRVLALAYKKTDVKKKEIFKKDLEEMVFVGVVGLADPLRKDVKSTIKIAKQAGIRIVMITGDYIGTAKSIASEIGIPTDKDSILNGEDLEKISEDELNHVVQKISIYTRVDPKHKIRIVKALQNNDEVVAMTGDGVNDAPAIKGADIGVAVGSGTDVSKEISDMVIRDDKLSTIVAAVEEGRRIYQNIKKVILYLLSGSFAEIILIGGSIIGGLPLAVLPVQILWVNLIEDSFPNMALAFDKGEKENMKSPPRKKDESIIDKEMKTMILIIGLVSNAILFSIFLYFIKFGHDLALTRTIIFVGLGIDSVLYIYSVRSMRHMVWQMNPFNNNYLTAAVLLGWILLVGAVYLPPLQTLLSTVPLGWQHWVIMVCFGLVNILLIELVKWIFLVRQNKII